MDKPYVKINMLGEFRISVGQDELLDAGKPRKLWNLLGFLLANHKRNISQQEMIDVLCSDEDTSDPVKVIKNLIYRLRKMLLDSPLPKIEYIVRNGNAYSWNNELNFDIDAEKFEELVSLFRKSSEKEERKKLYIEAINAYKGKFFPTAEYEIWAIELATYYQRLFLEAVHGLFDIAQKEDSDYEMLLPVFEKAMGFDKYDEDLHIMYMKSLVKANRRKEALMHYENTATLFYDELGVNTSEEFKELYKELSKEIKSVETDLGLIKEDFNEETDATESFFCEYYVFKDIYRFVARRIQRTGEPFYILLCTVTDKNGNPLPNDKQAKAMEELKAAISKTLRKGDVFSRYSVSQYVIMLSDISFENGRKVTDRLKFNYKNCKTADKVSVAYNLQAIDSKLI